MQAQNQKLQWSGWARLLWVIVAVDMMSRVLTNQSKKTHEIRVPKVVVPDLDSLHEDT